MSWWSWWSFAAGVLAGGLAMGAAGILIGIGLAVPPRGWYR